MNPEIKKFWEDSGGRVWVQTTPNVIPGVTNTPAYWFDKDDSTKRILVAVPWFEEANRPSTMAYWDTTNWVTEEYMLKVIKLKAFL